MGLFDKNPNEVNYAGGKKHFADVIKNQAPGDLLIWKQPEEDFNTNSTLIVMPGESAIFIDGGAVTQVFNEPGTYKLSTENYPFISRLRNAFTGGISAFHCIVYFVRSADSKEHFWGTPRPVDVRDKVWGVVTTVKGNGAYRFRITNPQLFLQKLLGNNMGMMNQEQMDEYFGEETKSLVMSTLSRFLNSFPGELIGLNAFTEEIAKTLIPKLDESFAEYGLSCIKFVISTLAVDMTKYDKFDQGQIELMLSQKKSDAKYYADISKAKAEMDSFQMQGGAYTTIQGMNILKDIANNPNSGGAANTGVGIGMGMAAGGVIGTVANAVFNNAGMNSQFGMNGMNGMNGMGGMNGMNAGMMPDNRFGAGTQMGAGAAPAQQQPAADDPYAPLQKLKDMLDRGLITQEVYDAKAAEFINKMMGI